MKKNKLGVLALLVLLCLSAAGCLFSFVYVQFTDLSRQNRLEILSDFERREKEFQILEKKYRDWQKLPSALQKFRRDNILSLDEFAAFRRYLDSCLAANQLQPPRIDLTFGSSWDNIKKVTVKFSLEGSYRDVKKFIFDMELKSKMYFFQSLDLSASATAVKGSFTLEVYLGE
jgi:Tfp pilus assembly protein PilO